ncbi:DinB family protein [Bacteroidota bacterium]
MNIIKHLVPAFLMFIVAACGGAETSEHGATPEMDEAAEMAADVYSGPNADLVAEFNTGGELLLASVDGLSEAQWTYRESEDRWNIAEVCEHVVLAEGGIVGGFVANLVSGEPSAEDTVDDAEVDAGVRAMIRDRSNPVQTNEQMDPTGAYATPADCIAAFGAVRAKTLEFLMTSDADFRTFSGTLTPEVPPMDAHQWLIFSAGHVERHVAQIDQVKADEGYPSM